MRPELPLHIESTLRAHRIHVLGLHVATATVFAVAAVVCWSARPHLFGRVRAFGMVCAAAMALLAAEKLLRLMDRAHEGLHHLGVPDPPLLNGIDDVFLLTGMAVAVAVAIAYRDVIVSSRTILASVAAAALFTATSFAIDALGPDGGPVTVAEEVLELAVSACCLAIAVSLRSVAKMPADVQPSNGVVART